MIKALEEQNALIMEFMHQTQGLTEERRISILASFCGNSQMAHCVQLQQNQDGSPSPRYWRKWKILRPKSEPEKTHVQVSFPISIAQDLVNGLGKIANSMSPRQQGKRTLYHILLLFSNAGIRPKR